MKDLMIYIAAAAGLVVATASGAVEPCTDGSAGGYECSHIELVASMTPAELGGSGERLNDIWGWTDPVSGEEYAIVGMFDGTAFVRLAADGTPTFLGRLRATDGQSSAAKPGAPRSGKFCHDECEGDASGWRDVKVHDNHAFVVSEASGHGMQVFDLTRLRGVTAPPADEYVEDFLYEGVGHAHNIVINEDLARAYIVGAGSRSAGEGGLHMLDISTPKNPRFLAEINDDGYTHDAHCVAYAGPSSEIAQGDDICFAANENSMTIWNVTDPQNPELLSWGTYSNTAYTHQVWLSEDHRYAYLNDELDEQGYGTRTHTRVFDVSDPLNPQFVRGYLAPTWAIDHNNYVKGRFLYQSNYLAGLRVLDIEDPENPVEAAYFDVASTDGPYFQGSWSNYPFFDSGHILVSDIHGGLFILKSELDDSSSQADIAVAVTADETGLEEGDPVPATVTVSNPGGITVNDVLVTMHVPGTADITLINAPADWDCATPGDVVLCRNISMAAGDSSELTLELSTSSDITARFVAMAYGTQVDETPSDNLVSTNVNLTATLSDNDDDDSSGGGSSGYGGGAPGLSLLAMLGTLIALRRRKFDS